MTTDPPMKPIRAAPRRVGAPAQLVEPEAPQTLAMPEVDLPAPAAPAPPTKERSAPTFTIHASLDDFPFEVSFTGSAETLAATVARLRAIGAVPPSPAAQQAAHEERKREAPICPYHGAMKESSKRPGSWYCPAKMGDGSYCTEKA